MKKFLIFFLILIALFYILSEFVGDRIIKGALENNLSSVLDRDINIDTLKINYLSKKPDLKGQNLAFFNTKGVNFNKNTYTTETLVTHKSSNKKEIVEKTYVS